MKKPAREFYEFVVVGMLGEFRQRARELSFC
jgi:hypothetical protein